MFKLNASLVKKLNLTSPDEKTLGKLFYFSNFTHKVHLPETKNYQKTKTEFSHRKRY